MSKEIQKPNDMLVSTLINGNVDTMDLLKGGINAGNTQFLDPESYKETKFIKEKFTDKDGNFREDLFNLAYLEAYKSYQDLAEMNTYKKLEDYIEYNERDIFAPLTSKKAEKGYEISPELNPLRRSHGVDSLFEYGRLTYSMRELAQMSKIWDTENQKWLDQTADDRGILGSLFGKSLVYATYDEDTDTIDPITGKKVHHKKGEWKLNDQGQYYTETIGNRQSYGKQFVAASDTLTKEGSAFNKFDFFDSDDVEKSLFGSVMKTTVKIAPYLIPHFNTVWGGVTAAIEMAKIMPTFAKAAEGLIIGGDKDKETAFTRAMNSWENYFQRYEKSYSDKGLLSNWSAEKMLDQVGDIFAQLYLMRAAGSISLMIKKDPAKIAAKRFETEVFPKILQQAAQSGSDLSAINPQSLISIAMSKMPEVKKAIEAQALLSKGLGMAYMALSSTADIYKEAIEGGFDRRMAGAAAVTAALTQYGIMMSEEYLNLGGWFLDESVGYSEGVQRKKLLELIKPYFNEINDGVTKISKTADKKEKAKIFQGLVGIIGQKATKLKYNSSEFLTTYLKNGITEGLEEMTEELISDATKGAFDFLASAGFGSNPDASFGVAEDFKSGSFLDRYLQNALGGFMGGMLFEFQRNRIEPLMDKIVNGKTPEEQTTIIKEIANGHLADLEKIADELGEMNDDLSAGPLNIDGVSINTSSEKVLSLGKATARVLKDYFRTLDGILTSEDLKLSDDQIIFRALRDEQSIQALEKSGLQKLLIDDFTKLSSDIASIKIALDLVENKEKEAQKNKDKKTIDEDTKDAEEKAESDFKQYQGQELDYSKQSSLLLRKILKLKRELVQLILNGQSGEKYLRKTLIGISPEIQSALGNVTLAEYTFLKYGVKYDDLKGTKGIVTQESVKAEWEKWKSNPNVAKKFLQFGTEAYDDFEKKFSEYIRKYAESGYGTVRQRAINYLFHDNNILLNEFLADNDDFARFKEIVNSLKGDDPTKKTGDIVLSDIFNLDELKLTEQVDKIIDLNPRLMSLMKSLDIDKEIVKAIFLLNIAKDLGNMNINFLSDQTLVSLINGYVLDIILEKVPSILQNSESKTLGDVINILKTEKELSFNTPLTDTESVITDTSEIALYLTKSFSIEKLDKISVGLATSLLGKYLTSESVIDGEIKKRIAVEAYNRILNLIAKNEEAFFKDLNNLIIYAPDYDPDDTSTFDFEKDEIKKLFDAVVQDFDNKPLDEIIEDWAAAILEDRYDELPDEENRDSYILVGEVKDWSNLTKENFIKLLKNKVKSYFVDDSMYDLYTLVKSKESKLNVLFEGLNSIDSIISEKGLARLFEVLERQHSLIRKTDRLENYIAQGEERQLLEGAIRALNVLKALNLGMSDAEVTFGNPFAINQLMKNYLKKYEIKSSRNYDTIDLNVSRTIEYDLAQLQREIEGYLQIADRSYTAKTQLDSLIKKQYTKYLLQAILKMGNKFTIGDVSLIPDRQERLEEENPEAALILYSQLLRNNFNKNFKSAESRQKAIRTLIKQLELDPTKLSRGAKPQNLNQEIKSEANFDYDLLLWLTSSLSANTKEFYYRYNKLIVDNPDNPFVPFYSQELAAWHAWAFAKGESDVLGNSGKNVTIHTAIMEAVYENSSIKIPAIPASSFFFINGIAGGGKTTVIGDIVSTLLSDKLQYTTAPNALQEKNFYRTINLHTKRKDEILHGSIDKLLGHFLSQDSITLINGQIFDLEHAVDKTTGKPILHEFLRAQDEKYLFKSDDLGTEWNFCVLREANLDKLIKSNVDLSTVPEVIFIDEATQVSLPKLQILNYLALKYGLKIVLMGDSILCGAKLGGDTLAFNDLFMYKSAKLNINVRASNIHIGKNNQEANRQLEVYENLNIENPSTAASNFETYLKDPNNFITWQYYQNQTTFDGYKLVNKLSDFQKDIARIGQIKQADRKVTIMVITELDSKGNPVNSEITTLLSNNGLKAEDITYYSPDSIHDKAVQGSEADYVIVDKSAFKGLSLNDKGQYLRSVYTFASRAKKGTLMELDNNTLKALGLINKEASFSQTDELPQLQGREKAKQIRSKELLDALGDYKPKQVDLPKLETRKKADGSEEYYRKNVESPKAATSKSKKSTDATQVDENEEEQLSDADKQILTETTNTKPDLEVSQNGTTGVFESKESNIVTDDEVNSSGENTTSSRMYSSMDSFNVEERDTAGTYRQADDGINFNLNGLFSEDRKLINRAMIRGFNLFRHLLASAKNKELIYRGIKDNKYIAYFLAEACPRVAFSQGVTDWDGTWETSDQLGIIYSEWFKNSVTIDDHYYVFAKSYNWETDKPNNISEKNKEDSVGEGKTILYYGIRIKSNEEHPLLNLYFSLGVLSQRINPVTKEAANSRELKIIYNQADKDLAEIEDPKKKFVAYRLPDSTVFNLNIRSTMWIRNIKKPDQRSIDAWESLYDIQGRGFDIDTGRIFLVDKEKISINGELHYKFLVVLAARGYSSMDINNLFKDEKISFEQRLKNLEKAFVNDKGELRVAGSYMAIANYVSGEIMDNGILDSRIYSRPIFLNGASYTANEVLKSLLFKPKASTGKVDNEIRGKIAKCSPASLTDLMTLILVLAGAFADPFILKKYLLGIRLQFAASIGNGFANDRLTLNALIQWVDEKIRDGVAVSPTEFHTKLTLLGHRILFYPFFVKFIKKADRANDWKIVDLKNVKITKNDQDVEVIAVPQEIDTITFNADELPKSIAYPVIAHTKTKVNLIELLGLNFPEEITINKDAFTAFQIAYNPKTTSTLIGMYGYQLQDPTYQIPDAVLRTFERVTEPLVLAGKEEITDPVSGEKTIYDYRFPDRGSFEDIPSPNSGDDSTYAPSVLAETAYDIDPSFKKYFVKRETKKIKNHEQRKQSKGNTQSTDKVRIHGRFVTIKGHLVFKPSKEALAFLKNAYGITKYESKYVTIKEYKTNKVAYYTVPKKTKKSETKSKSTSSKPTTSNSFGLYTEKGKGKGKFISLHVLNKFHFDIRPGDQVRLNGDKTTAYYVEHIDVNKKMMTLTMKSDDPNGCRKEDLHSMKHVQKSIDEVTAVVRRTVAERSLIEKDIYRIGNFKVKPKFDGDEYTAIIKSADTFDEMLEAMDEEGVVIKSLDFDKYAYLAIPLYNGESGDKSIFKHAERPDAPGGVTRPKRIFNKLSELIEWNEEIQDEEINPEVEGYTLFRLFKGYNNGMYIDIATDEETINNQVEKMEEAIIAAYNQLMESSVIQHQIIFDEDIVKVLDQGYAVRDLAKIPYDELKILETLNHPFELLVFNEDGSLDLEKSAKFIKHGEILPKLQYDVIAGSAKYPSTKWMHRILRDNIGDTKYEMIPRASFIFAGDKKSNGQFTYNLTSDSGTGVDGREYDRFIVENHDPNPTRPTLDPSDVADYWTKKLQGVEFFDYLKSAYAPLGNTNPKTNAAWKKGEKEKAQKILEELVLARLDTKLETENNIKLAIVSLYIKNGELMVRYAASGNYKSGNLDVTYEESFKQFLFNLGARFRLTGTRVELEFTPAVSSSTELVTIEDPELPTADDTSLEDSTDEPTDDSNVDPLNNSGAQSFNPDDLVASINNELLETLGYTDFDATEKDFIIGRLELFKQDLTYGLAKKVIEMSLDTSINDLMNEMPNNLDFFIYADFDALQQEADNIFNDLQEYNVSDVINKYKQKVGIDNNITLNC